MESEQKEDKKPMSRGTKLSIALGLVALGFGIYAYYNPRSDQKLPVYSIENTGIISKSQVSLPDLIVSYKNHPVKLLTSTNIRFWNAGKKSIRRSDIYNKQPLIIVVPKGVNIFSYDPIKQTDVNARPKLTMIDISNGKGIVIDFDYLDYKDGFWIQILHDGNTDVKWTVAGKIIESQSIVEFKKEKDLPSILSIIEISIMGVILIIGCIHTIKNNIALWSEWYWFVLLILGIIFGLLMLTTSVYELTILYTATTVPSILR